MVHKLCIDLTNPTNERLFNVDIFNNDYKNNNKITYSNAFFMPEGKKGYDIILRSLEGSPDEAKDAYDFISSMKLITYSDSNLTKQMQLTCGIHISKDGMSRVEFFGTTENPDIVNGCCFLNLETRIPLIKNLKVKLEYLEPFTSIRLFMFIEDKNDKIRNMDLSEIK